MNNIESLIGKNITADKRDMDYECLFEFNINADKSINYL